MKRVENAPFYSLGYLQVEADRLNHDCPDHGHADAGVGQHGAAFWPAGRRDFFSDAVSRNLLTN